MARTSQRTRKSLVTGILSQTISARSQVFSGAESGEESTSFLKKRSKKLLFAVADL
jgi:hypothetical protein